MQKNHNYLNDTPHIPHGCVSAVMECVTNFFMHSVQAQEQLDFYRGLTREQEMQQEHQLKLIQKHEVELQDPFRK